MKLDFYGTIDNTADLANQLGMAQSTTEEALLLKAFLKWGVNLNCHVAGDYAIVLKPDQAHLFICRSAFSSYPLYYTEQDDALVVSENLDTFKHKAQLSTIAIRMLMEHGMVLPPYSLLENISQLASGESQLWLVEGQLEKRHSRQLSLKEKFEVSDKVGPELPTRLSGNETKADFNALPGISRQLGQPLTDNWQIAFAQSLEGVTDSAIVCEAGPEFMTAKDSQSPADVAKKVLRPLKGKTDKLAKTISTQITQRYEQEIKTFEQDNPPAFAHWFTLSYRLPEIWSQMRKLAIAADKEIRFSYTNPVLAATLLDCPEQGKNYQGLFQFSDITIRNLFDAMQRLMWHGKPDVTNTLFTIVPPLSAGVLKKHPQHPKAVDSFCLTTLTLDYLAKQNQWTLA